MPLSSRGFILKCPCVLEWEGNWARGSGRRRVCPEAASWITPLGKMRHRADPVLRPVPLAGSRGHDCLTQPCCLSFPCGARAPKVVAASTWTCQEHPDTMIRAARRREHRSGGPCVSNGTPSNTGCALQGRIAAGLDAREVPWRVEMECGSFKLGSEVGPACFRYGGLSDVHPEWVGFRIRGA